MTNYKIIIACFLMCSLFSCTKEEFIADPGTPVFMIEAPFVNSTPFNAVAGDNLYYMFASHQYIDNEKTYSGLFGKEESCEEACQENLAIKIINTSGDQSDIGLGKYDFYSVPKDGYKHDYTLLTEEENYIENATWRIGNDTHMGESLSYDGNFENAIDEKLELVYNVPEQITLQFERSILPRSVTCDINLNVRRVVGEGIFISIETSSPYSYVAWSTGEVSEEIKVNLDLQSYSASVYDASGCQTNVIVHFKTKNITNDISVGFSQNSYVFSIPDNDDQSVLIEYTSPEGEFFRSSLLGQIQPYEFEIVNVENYEKNELGNPTLKIEAEFGCILYSNKGNTKRIKNGQAIFAISY